MTVTDQIKTLDRKIKENEAEYDSLSSNNLDKNEYLTGEILGLKSSTVGQAKFEYSLLGKVFTKRLDKLIKKKDFLRH